MMLRLLDHFEGEKVRLENEIADLFNQGDADETEYRQLKQELDSFKHTIQLMKDALER